MPLTKAQLELRKNGIGASESAMVLGESPFGGPIDVYLDKVGLADNVETVAQEVGNVLEHGVSVLYMKRTKSTLSKCTTLVHPEKPWIMATPDRFVNACKDKTLQIKVVGAWMAHHWGSDGQEAGVPEYVRIQVTQEMAVAGVDHCDVAALIGGTDFRIYPVKFDPELWALIESGITEFWHECVVKRIPPALDGSSSADEYLKAKYAVKRARCVAASNEATAWALRYQAAEQKSEPLAAEMKLAEQHLKALIGEDEGIEGETWRATWKANKNGVRSFKFTTLEKKKRAA